VGLGDSLEFAQISWPIWRRVVSLLQHFGLPGLRFFFLFLRRPRTSFPFRDRASLFGSKNRPLSFLGAGEVAQRNGLTPFFQASFLSSDSLAPRGVSFLSRRWPPSFSDRLFRAPRDRRFFLLAVALLFFLVGEAFTAEVRAVFFFPRFRRRPALPGRLEGPRRSSL